MKNKLVIGSGIILIPDAVNMDISPCKGVDVVWDFNKYPWKPFKDNQFEHIIIPNSIHCAENLSKFMEEVYRIAKPNAIIEIVSTNFLSPICCQDPFFKTRIGFNTFDVFETHKLGMQGLAKGVSYDTSACFEILEKKWIFSKNKYLYWLSFFPNLFPKFYARFGYFYFPCNDISFKLRCIKS